jgi:hypothetical protein
MLPLWLATLGEKKPASLLGMCAAKASNRNSQTEALLHRLRQSQSDYDVTWSLPFESEAS